MKPTAVIPSLLVFGPLTELPSREVLEELRLELVENSQLTVLLDAVKDLATFWQTLTDFDPELKHVPGSKYLGDLLQWVVDGGSFPHYLDQNPNVYCLPVTIILHTTQYVRYLDHLGGTEPHRLILDGVRAGGIQGFCVGFLSAIAISTSYTQGDIAAKAAVSLRLAVCVGAYVDRDGSFAQEPSSVVCVAVRWRSDEVKEKALADLIRDYPGAYISSFNDDACVTVTLRSVDLANLSKNLQTRGFLLKPVHVQGRFHSEAHASAGNMIAKFSVLSAQLQFPAVDSLRAPVRSTVNGEIISEGSLLKIALENTLLKPAHWYKTLESAITQLPENHKAVAFAGLGSQIPASLVHSSGLEIFQLGNLSGSQLEFPGRPPSLNGFANGAPVNGNHSRNANLENGQHRDFDYPLHSIAIVGMSGRFPGADDLDELWDLLLSGGVTVKPASTSRLRLPGPKTGDASGTQWWGNFLNDPDCFDHRFFKKSSREAVHWDPQQRILLEVVYEALESAGYFHASSDTQPDDYGCYIGAVMNNYYDNVSCHPATAYATIGTSRCFLSGCMSHYFGWTGPSLTIDTACSSSLVAINTACRAIWSGECSRAIAGGTNVITSPFDYQNLHAAGFLSPSGQCKPFDASADGYCRGEGIGVVVLKLLSTALNENDNILGVIVGSAANQNHNLSHITVPHSRSQVKLYQKVMDLAGVEPGIVSYVEAHGTGTGVGDPVEYQSIREAFAGPSRDTILYFGSIKGNIGHTEATAGIAGLIKVLLMMQHERIPAQASHIKMNPKIPILASDHMAISRSLLPWNPAVRVACVNSYGAAGSNAAIMIRQAPPKALLPSNASQRAASSLLKYPLFISAGSARSLSMYCQKLTKWLEKLESNSTAKVSVADLTFNLADRANHSLPHILSTTVTNIDDLKLKISTAATRTSSTEARNPKPVVLVFGGQESSFVGLSEDIYESSVLFRHHLDSCNDTLRLLGLEGIYPSIFQHDPISNLVTLHAALFSIQYASAKAWITSGLNVDAIIGHSFGQLTALCVSGTLSLQDALKLVTGRASIMLRYWGSERGSMIFLQIDEQKVLEILALLAAQEGERAEIACYNGPKSHVVVGSAAAIEALERLMAESSSLSWIRRKRLRVTHGFHSCFTESLLPHLTALARSLEWNCPSTHLETCDEVRGVTQPDFRLISRHTRRPVYFRHAVERVTQRFPQSLWIEAGCGSSIISLTRGCIRDIKGHLFLSPQLSTANAQESLTDTTIELWKAGYSVQYWHFHRSQRSHYLSLSLPPYQFEKTQLWLPFTGRGTETVADPKPDEHLPTAYDLLTFVKFKDDIKREALFHISPRSDRFKAMLGGHVMAGQSLAPASLYFEIAARAALFLQSDIAAKTYVPTVQDLVMKSPIGLDIDRDIVLCLKQLENSRPFWQFSITTQSPPSASGHISEPFEQSTGIVHLTKRDDAHVAQNFNRFETLTGFRRYEHIMNHPEAEKMRGNHIYRAFNHIVHYGENFRGIKDIACMGMEAAGRVSMTVNANDPADQRLCDTPMTDSFMQFAGFLVNYFNNPSLEDVLVCMKIERIEIGGSFTPDATEWIVYSNMTEGGDSDASADAYVFDAVSKKMVMAAFGFRFSKMSQSLLARMLKSVNRKTSPNKQGGKIASQSSDDPVVEVSLLQPKAAKKSSSKRADVFQVLSNVTDIPLKDLKNESTLEDLGIDSLMATEVLNDIRATLGLTIDLTSFLFFPNIQAIASYVDSKLGGDQESNSDSSQVDNPATDTDTPSLNTGPVPSTSLASKSEHQVLSASISLKSSASNRPTITSSFNSFNSIRLGYDQLAVGTKAVNFCKQVYPDQARLVLAYVTEAYAKLGCDLKDLLPGDPVPALQSLPRHKQLVRQLYRVLEDAQLISPTEEGFVRTNFPVDLTPAEALYQRIIDPYPQHVNVHKLVKAVGSELASCLVGEKDGLQVVFGDKTNKHTLEDMYQNWPLLRTPTLLLGDFLINAFTNFTGSGKFRLLEIGAGTGGTTRYIINHLQTHGIPFEYTFTDISSSLVTAARKHFKGVEGMSFEILDIEKPPKLEYEGAFHIIIATNCIHATRKLSQSLLHLRKMLREDGALTLVEITKNMFWLDIVVGLFEGWWLFEDGRSHALVNEKHWERLMKEVGFKEVLWTDGSSPESKMVRVIGAFPSAPSPKATSGAKENKKVSKAALETVIYKRVGDIDIHADVYYPTHSELPTEKMPIALMIHGGSHIIFSRKDIRPAQTRLLLDKGFLPVSLDHRLCPEVKLSEGPMVDVCDALEWARYTLPQIKLQRPGLQIDGERVVVVGWSSGGQLAMSLAWTAPQRGLRPPEAILAFYCPTNYEDEWWTHPIQPVGAVDKGLAYDLLEGIQEQPITNYGVVGAWEPLSDPRILADPRCRIILHINWKAQTLPIIIGGLLSKKQAANSEVVDWKKLPQPGLEEIIPVSPLAQVVRGNYKTPTFLIHGTNDDLIPWQQSQGTYDALVDRGIVAGLALVEGAPHICDLSSDPESEGWKAALKGYEFISNFVFQ